VKRKILLHATIRGLVLLLRREGGPHISSFSALRPKPPVERFSSTPIVDRGILLWKQI